MAGDYKLPLTISKRVRFFDGQFLQDQDFIDEQKYNLARQNRHRRSLHVSGVVEGLTVYKPANSTLQVKVRSGAAIDTDGRSIVLASYSDAIELPEDAKGSVRWLYIAYHQEPTDLPSTSQGVEEETRWMEAPYIFATAAQLGIDDTYVGPDWNGYLAADEGPPPPVLLAKLTVADNGAVTIDESVRHYAGARFPGPDDTIAPVLRTDTGGNVGLWQVYQNDLTERLTISREGKVGINANAPAAALEIGSTLQATKNGDVLVGLKIAPTYNENRKESVQKYGLLVTSGSVGIGTTTPKQTLDVNGRIHLNNGVIQRGGNPITNTSDLGLYSQLGGHWMRFVTNNAPIRFFTDSGVGSTTRLSIEPSGNVGIGLTDVTAQLDIKGSANTVNQTSLQLRSGNGNNNFNSNQLTFGYSNSAGYRHAIKTRHNAGARNGNAIDFYVWKYLSAEDKDEVADIGTLHTMTLDGGFVGVGVTTPGAKLHVMHEAQDANGNALIVGPTNGANVRLGYHANYSWMQSHGGKPLSINPLGNNVGIKTVDPGAALDVNGSFRANSDVSGEREIYLEAPAGVDHRGDGVVQNGTGLTYRVKTNPGDGEPIFQVRSSGQAVRLFVEHNGWTGSTHNSAWFGGSFDNYFAGKVGIGTSEPGEKLEVTGRVKAKDLTVGPWPANGAYSFFGVNGLDQSNAGNYALLQAATTNSDVGRTYLNSPVDIRFRVSNKDKMTLANNGYIGIGTTAPTALLSLGISNSGASGPEGDGATQLLLSGKHNSGVNKGSANGTFKLKIEGYNNDGDFVYPIYCIDENNKVDFSIRGRTSDNGRPEMYFAGNMTVAGNIKYRGQSYFSKTGTISHGQTIPVPSGTSKSDWNVFVSPNDMGIDEGSSDKDNALLYIQCSVNSNWVVTCRYRFRWSKGTGSWRAGVANYILVPK